MNPQPPNFSGKSRWSFKRTGLHCSVLAICFALFFSLPAAALGEYEPKPSDPYFAKFNPRKAPESGAPVLRQNDRLAIIGDSITEQKMYSRIMETYLTVCVPQLNVSVRQYGWSGETAEGFLRRMTNDCLRFKPTVATLFYGMNDHRYRPFDVTNGEWYRDNYTAVVRGLRGNEARVVLGSPGCVSKVPHWTKSEAFTMDELNINLCALRDIDIEISGQEEVGFADVFWTMFKAGYEGQQRFATPDESFMIGGKDGVHPGWAGQLVMAYTFLRALGLEGDIGTITLDLESGSASSTEGHTIDQVQGGEVQVTSVRYPFCADGPVNRDDSIRSGMQLVPFNEELNRLTLIVTGGKADEYLVTWGESTLAYSAKALASGINLAADFPNNPFSEAFNRVDQAVLAKQAYETTQVKQVFHGEEGRKDMEAAVKRTEVERAALAVAIPEAFTPVTHRIRVVALE